MNDTILELKGVTKKFKRGGFFGSSEFTAVDNVSFKIKKGEIISLIGESGSGKTTVGQMVLKLLKPSSGEILFAGENIISYNKTKLNTFYLTVPLIFEFQFGPKKKGFFGVGVIGDLKLSSKTKLKYNDGGSKQKEKHKDDFNLSPLRYHLTARAGFRCIKVFANVSMVPFFEKDMGPELYPFTIGLTIINFR